MEAKPKSRRTAEGPPPCLPCESGYQPGGPSTVLRRSALRAPTPSAAQDDRLPELFVQPVARHRIDARQRRSEHFALLLDERRDARLCQTQHRRHFLVAERCALGGALQLDEAAFV